MAASLPYQRLDPVKREIRLLLVAPGRPGSPIHAKLQAISLDDKHAPPFEAISYMWGEATAQDARLHLGNNMIFPTTSRVEAVLDDMRHETDTLIVWIDGICINQKDPDEINNQVPMMRSIYRSASRVKVWLDLDMDPNTEAFLRLLTLDENSTLPDLGEEPDFWDPVREIFLNPYWGRVWIQQEISNARSLTIQCKKVNIEVYHLYHYKRVLNDASADSIMKSKWWEWAGKIPPVTLPARFGLIHESAKSDAWFIGSTLGEKDLDIIEVLSETLRLKCSNDRDRLYGIMHLAADYEEGDIAVDYKLSVSEVFTQASVFVLKKHRSLRFLLYATISEEGTATSTEDQTPSWVPDWRRPKSRMVLPFVLPSLSASAAGLKDHRGIQAQVSDDNRVLSVYGSRIDSIHRTYKPLFDKDVLSMTISEFVTTLRRMASEAIGMNKDKQMVASDDVISKEDYGEDNMAIEDTTEWQGLIRTICGADNRDSKTNWQELYTILYTSARSLSTLSDHGTDLGGILLGQLLNADSSLPKEVRIAAAVAQFTWWTLLTHVPFLSSRGVFGLAYMHADQGDEIWRIEGLERLVSLRPVLHLDEQRDDSLEHAASFQSVGEAYLDGSNLGEHHEGIKQPAMIHLI